MVMNLIILLSLFYVDIDHHHGIIFILVYN